jgi:ABC-type Fe3+-siderophore transport system permease subunit
MTSPEVKEYQRRAKKKLVWAAVFVVIIFLLSIYSLSVSTYTMSFAEAYQVLINHILGIEPTTITDIIRDKIVVGLTAPRTIAAVFVGGVLAVCGAVMQSITRNPLADPYTIGISSAALFGTSLTVALGISIIPFLGHDVAIASNAFVFALIPALAIVFVSSFKKMSPNMMILIGIGMMYLFTAATTFVKFNASEEALQEIYEWSLGTLSKINWDSILPLAVAFVMALLVFMMVSNRINVLSAGDNMSRSLGENPIRLRVVCFVIVSVTTAIAVCYTGTIGFVGLVAPHIARLFVGSDNKILIPVSAILGAIMISATDCLVRLLPGGLPCGVMTAMIGAPIFVFILYKQRKKAAF